MCWKLPDKGDTYAFACCAVGQVRAVVLLSYSDHASSNNRASQCGTQKVLVLEDGVAHDGTADDVVYQLTLKVLADESLGTQLQDKVSKDSRARKESGIGS